MKKLLTIIGSLTMIASTASVVACKNSTTQKEKYENEKLLEFAKFVIEEKFEIDNLDKSIEESVNKEISEIKAKVEELFTQKNDVEIKKILNDQINTAKEVLLHKTNEEKQILEDSVKEVEKLTNIKKEEMFKDDKVEENKANVLEILEDIISLNISSKIEKDNEIKINDAIKQIKDLVDNKKTKEEIFNQLSKITSKSVKDLNELFQTVKDLNELFNNQ
ncbi:lipoprotein [Vibrio harveyi]|nr:lipoprotein [Vibrio harveyi]